MKTIDACGRACPEPVLMTKRGLAESPEGVAVTVDNPIAVENISRFAVNSGYHIKKTAHGACFILEVTR